MKSETVRKVRLGYNGRIPPNALTRACPRDSEGYMFWRTHSTSSDRSSHSTWSKRTFTTCAAAAVLVAAMLTMAACTAGSGGHQSLSLGNWSVLEQALSSPNYQAQGSARQSSPQEGTSIQIDGLRDRFVDTSMAKSATVMVYMCGSDLESYSAAASSDIQEMCEAALGKNVNVVLETGGATRWHFTKLAKSNQRQRWLIDSEGMYYLEDVGSGSLLDKKTLTEFINWSVKNYPADRYILVFWDHGGGTIGGWGNDEIHPMTNSLSLLDLRQAIQDSGQKFDLIGFDACLMGTIETAYALEPVADYLMASEEYELGDGWEWTGFLSAIGENPAIDTVELGKTAIDDFTNYYFSRRQGEITLSLVDLREIPYVYERMGDFLAAAENSISTDNARFTEMSKARKRARSFADGGIDQVDVIDLIERTSFEGRDDLLAAVQSCVKYRSGTTIAGANGLAMYFPYSEVREYKGMRTVLNKMGYVRPTEFYDYFLSVMGGSPASSTHSSGLLNSSNEAYEQQGSAASGSTSSNTYANSTFSAEEWFEALFGSTFNYQTLPDQLDVEYEDGGYVISMNQELWDAFSSFHTTVMEEAGGGYIMLGRDDVYYQTDDDDIVVFYGNEWLTLGGQPVSFFSSEPTEEANGEYSQSGTIPALLNGKTQIEIVVYWPTVSEQPTDEYIGYIQGYRLTSESGSHTYGRGLTPFEKGDVVTPLFDFYDAQGNYSNTIKGSEITINSSSDLEVRYELFDHNTVHFWGTMVTVYGDTIDTPVITQ